MELTPYVDAVRHELAVAAEAGGPEARAVSQTVNPGPIQVDTTINSEYPGPILVSRSPPELRDTFGPQHAGTDRHESRNVSAVSTLSLSSIRLSSALDTAFPEDRLTRAEKRLQGSAAAATSPRAFGADVIGVLLGDRGEPCQIEPHAARTCGHDPDPSTVP